ncbi:MAG: hypothetical protein P8J42_06995, partial [Pseudomonadales bacterium]|nr:hypothetical protein [Pseudomonadales bacterium]
RQQEIEMNIFTRCAVIITLATSTGAMAASINDRQDNQQTRIKQGVHSGELTKREAGHLSRQQIKTQRKEAYFKSDGSFTKKERAILHRDLSKNSAKIYKQKHDGQQRF